MYIGAITPDFSHDYIPGEEQLFPFSVFISTYFHVSWKKLLVTFYLGIIYITLESCSCLEQLNAQMQ